MVKKLLDRFTSSFRRFNIPIFIISFLFSLTVLGQDTVPFEHELNTQDSLEILYNTYITSNGDPELKIKELMSSMNADYWKGDIPGALKKYKGPI